MRKLPVWLLVVIGIATVILIGIIDYLAGDYSMLIFYAIPVAFVGWLVGRWGAALVGLLSGIARFISDYFSYSISTVRYWNSLQDMFFLLLLGLLVATLHELIDMEESKRDQ